MYLMLFMHVDISKTFSIYTFVHAFNKQMDT